MRKARGYLTGSVSASRAPRIKFGTPALAMTPTVARDSPEFTGPMMMCTLSEWMSWLAKFTALVGSPAVSRVSSSTGRPRMPPRLLISSTANSTPLFSAMAADDSGPVSDESQPILIGSLPCAWATPSVIRAARPRVERIRMPRTNVNMGTPDVPLGLVSNALDQRFIFTQVGRCCVQKSSEN